MGFIFENQGGGRACLRLESEQDLDGSLARVGEQVIKQRVNRLEFDLRADPVRVAPAIDPLLRWMQSQKLVPDASQVQWSVVVRAASVLGGDVARRLRAMGVDILEESPDSIAGAGGDDIDPEVWQTEANQRLAAARAGRFEEADGLFRETRERLAKLIREERALGSEATFYRTRLEELRRVVPVGAELRAALERNQEIENRLTGLRSELSALRRRRRELSETVTAIAARLEAGLRAKAAETDRDIRALQADIEAEKTRRAAMVLELEAEARARRETISKLQKAKPQKETT